MNILSNDHAKIAQLTIIVTASSIPSHPSIELIKNTVDSLSLLTLPPNTPILLAHDYAKSGSYDKYFETLELYIQDKPHIRIIKKPSPRGYLTGNLKHAFNYVQSEYVLVIQHDFPFVAPVNIVHVIEDMIHRPELKHVRFNKRRNLKIGSDAMNDLFGYQCDAVHHTYTRTPSWSDNNHITLTKYYLEVVFLDCGDQFMETNLIKRSTNETIHKKYGTYLYGPLNHPQIIHHLDGRNYK